MTTWVEPEGGRERGPVGLAKAFTQVLVNPTTFFEEAVSPGDQAPGLVFAMAVVLVSQGTRLALAPGRALEFPAPSWLAATLTLALAVLLIAPAALHALSAVETLVLAAVIPDRGGVSETVQVLAYASAPCAFVGVGVPVVTFVCGLWAFALLVLGTRIVHDTSFARAAVTALAPGALAYGSGFGWFAATTALFPWTADYMPWVGRAVEAAAVLGV
ncbi:YIP1 family protein [Halobacterium noricense]|uniref:YIP1 family protein n=1 Tax=Halobacterium noricense TaxID=223182 RepID=UPI001E4CF588|nr:YIP1 family protein [Halobacterium noricense]UHH24320.1 YIP1 family protein [Halobacterium noricense]